MTGGIPSHRGKRCQYSHLRGAWRCRPGRHAGGRTSRYNIDPNRLGVAPRIGFAYTIDPKTVVRGGYGMFWMPIDANWATNPLNDPVNSIQTDYVGNNGNVKVPTNTITTPWINFVQPPGAPHPRMPAFHKQRWILKVTQTHIRHSIVRIRLYAAVEPRCPAHSLGGWFADVAYAANKERTCHSTASR